MILEGNEEHRTPELCAQFLNSIREILHGKGYTLETMATKTWPTRSRAGPGNRLLVTGWKFQSLRAMIYTFNNYTWESDVGAPIVVKIQSSTIEQELGHNATLRLLATRPTILGLEESLYITQKRNCPAPRASGSSLRDDTWDQPHEAPSHREAASECAVVATLALPLMAGSLCMASVPSRCHTLAKP